MLEANRFSFVSKYFNREFSEDTHLSFALLTEIYHASIGEKYSKSFILNNQDKLGGNICFPQDGMDDVQRFRFSDGKEISLPIVALSRYFSYFDILYELEEIETLISFEFFEILRNILNGSSTYLCNSDSIIKQIFKYFGAKPEAYLLITISDDYDNSIIQYLNHLLKNSFVNKLLQNVMQEWECVDDHLWFAAYQYMLYYHGKLFTATYLYDNGYQKLGLKIYFYYRHTYCSYAKSPWIDRLVDHCKLQLIERKGLIVGLNIYHEQYKDILQFLEEKFIGILDKDDLNIFIIFGQIANYVCRKISLIWSHITSKYKPILYLKRKSKDIVSNFITQEEWVINILYSVMDKIIVYHIDKRKECEYVKKLLDIAKITRNMCTEIH